jgi:hypothetical protein
MLKAAVVANLEYYLNSSLEGLKKITKNLSE